LADLHGMDVVGLAPGLRGEVVEFAHAVAIACVHLAVVELGVADGVNEDVVVLGGFDGVDEVVFAGVFFTVREDDEDFAALMDVHHLFGSGVEDGIVEGGAEVAVFDGAEFGAVAVALVVTAEVVDDGGLVVGPVVDQAEMVSEAQGESAVLGKESLVEKIGDIALVILDEFLAFSNSRCVSRSGGCRNVRTKRI